MEKVVLEKLFRSAIVIASEEQADDALRVFFRDFKSHSEFVPYLVELIEADWHNRHEDIAQCLQHLKDNRATPALRRTALRKFGYLDEDNSYSLARKCTWALADIGTEESRSALEEIARFDDEIIAGYALRRLERWHSELDRKGGREI
jgi:hypothetical protein